MDFATTPEQDAIFEMAYDFGQEHIAPHARAWEAAGTIPKELWPRVAELGLGGIYVSEEFGGSGLSRLDAKAEAAEQRAVVPNAFELVCLQCRRGWHETGFWFA